MNNAQITAKLLKIGTECKKNGHHRIYIPLDKMLEIAELQVNFDKTGNIYSARLHGDIISTSWATKYYNFLKDHNAYYDVNDNGFYDGVWPHVPNMVLEYWALKYLDNCL